MTKVTVGPATICGYVLTALGVVGTIVSAAGTNLHLSTESIALISGAIGVATNALRSWQARELIKVGK